MKEETKKRLLELATNDIGAAEDNLARARAAFRNKTQAEMQEKWGASSKTCQEILDGYINWYNEATKVKAELELV